MSKNERSRFAWGLLACITSLIIASPSNASILRIDKDSTEAIPDGTAWSKAFPTLSAALTAASSGDILWVADGTYKPTTGTDRTISFTIDDKALRIYGGFQGISRSGGGESDLDQRNPIRNRTILSGDIGTASVTSDNSYHVFTVTNVEGVVILDGLTFSDGNANSSPNDRNGGGLRLLDGASTDIRVVKCIFENNLATDRGAGAYFTLSNGMADFVNCTFRHNGSTSTIRGGGIASDGCSCSFTNCLFYENIAQSGAGLWLWNGGSTLVNCTVAYNTATGSMSAEGGGVWVGGSIAENITNCILWGNTDELEDTEGAQVFEYTPELTSGPDVTYTIIEACDTYCGEPSNSDADPMFVDVGSDDYRLDSSSPAINAGSDVAVPDDIGDLNQDDDPDETTPVDLDLQERFVGDVDIGAFEFTPCPGNLDSEEGVDSGDLAVLLGAWGNPGCGGAIPCTSDLNHDSAVDSADSAILLGLYGECSESFGGGDDLADLLVTLGFECVEDFIAWLNTASDVEISELATFLSGG